MACVLTILLTATLATQAAPAADEPIFPVPETIRAEGVPAIPRAVADALIPYQNIRSAVFQGWDRDHRRALYITTRFGDVMQVHHVPAPGAARRQLTFSSERVLGVSSRPKRGEFLFIRDEGGAENYQLFLQNRAFGEPFPLTDGKSRHLSPRWSPTGELLAWSSNRRNGRDMDLYLASPADPSFRKFLREVSGQWTVSDWSPDGKRLLVEEYISITESYVHIVSTADGLVQTITPKPDDGETTVAVSGPRWTKDGKSVFYTSNKGSDFQRLARYDLATGEETWFTNEIPWDVEGFDLSDDGQYVAVVVNEDGLSALHLYETATAQKRNAPRLPQGRISGLEFRPGSLEFAFTLDSAQASSDVFGLQLESGAREPAASTVDSDVFPTNTNAPVEFAAKLSRWTESETGGLDVTSFASPELIRYPSFDDVEIPAFVYRPTVTATSPSPGPRPVLIQIHGGPEAQFRPGFLGRLNYLINKLGIVVIAPNVRGSAGYGTSYLKMDDGFLREDPVKDIGALLDWIAAQPDLDESRVAVAGGSYGGFMSLAVQTNYNDRIKCGIDVVGISNFVTFLENTQEYRRDLRRAEYGDERDPKMREFLERVSPLNHVEKIKTPILVVQGANDPRVPLSESEQLVSAVKKNGAPVWYVVGENEGHGFAKKPNQDYQQAVEVLFLQTFLLEQPSL